MTTPGGVPNLPIGALTVETLASRLQDQTATAMRSRAGEQMPAIFGASNGGDIMSDLSPFGILTNIWAGINSLIANSDPNDIQGPDDLPPLFTEFIESLPVIGQFVELLEALSGNYTGDDSTLNAIQDLLAPVLELVGNISEGLQAFLGWIWEQFGPSVDTFLKPVAEFLNWLWIGAPGGFDGLGQQVESILKPLVEWLTWLWNQFGEDPTVFLTPVTEFLAWLWNGVTGGFAGFGDTVDTVLKPLIEWLNSIWQQFGSLADTFLTPVIEFLHWLWNGVAGGFTGFGSTVETVLKPAFEFLQWLFGTAFAGAVETLKNIFTALDRVTPQGGTLQDWVSQVPLIGNLFSAITGLTESDGVIPGMTQLAIWAKDLLTQKTSIPAANLTGEIPPGLLSLIPVANINIESANLLSQGAFGTSGTVDAVDGWEWDGTTNDPAGSSSGSAKLTTAGAARYLYSRQAVKVAAGDKIKLSARVRTASYTGGANSIVLSVIPYIGTTAQTEKVFATRGASNGAWATMTGTAVDVNPYTVPANVTSLIVKVGVTADSGTGSTLWVDNIDMRKEGLLGQNLVEYLINAWGNLWQGLVGTSGAGKTWADMLNAADALRTFAGNTDTNLSGLQGDLLTAPAAVLGSLFSVVFDGTKTVGDFLRLLYNALNKSNSTTPKTADDVATAAADLKDATDQAATDAADAKDAADLASTGTTNLRTTLVAGYTVVTANSTTTWTKPNGITDLWVILFGAGANGTNGTTNGLGGDGSPGGGNGKGGAGGAVIARQVNPTEVPASLTVTVGTAASPTTSFGSLVLTTQAYAAYVATPLGLLPSSSAPSAGGNGGTFNSLNQGTSSGAAGVTTSAGVSGGTGGSAGSFLYSGANGGSGQSGLNFGLCRTGGSGGGGGGGSSAGSGGTKVGGAGGAGGFPGGGGGGGGDGSSGGGAGGAGANGLALIIYKTANTVV